MLVTWYMQLVVASLQNADCRLPPVAALAQSGLRLGAVTIKIEMGLNLCLSASSCLRNRVCYWNVIDLENSCPP
jgi:hypothetical protein